MEMTEIKEPFLSVSTIFQIRKMMDLLITLLIEIKVAYHYCYKIKTSSLPDLIKL